MKNADPLLAELAEFAAGLAAQRGERQRRRELDLDGFRQLARMGLHLAAVPVEAGGYWESVQHSLRPLCEALRILATGDPSLALAASMHPGVLAFWRDAEDPDPANDAWERQKREVFQTAVDGGWWGTITSESGSGGDIAKTRTIARRDGDGYRITGEKHFGSGSGATSYMFTVALPEGETEPAVFFLRVRDVPWDGSAGMTLLAEWDGHGMAATNSHAFAFRDFPATRIAWPGNPQSLIPAGRTILMFFSAVFVGIVEAAMDFMRGDLARRGSPAETMRAFDKVEWVMAEREAWLVRQSYEGGLNALAHKGNALRDAALAKANIATLAESVLTRLCRIAGGGVFARRSPLGYWFEDVRALGFLRPPWSLASDALFEMSWAGKI
jgi:alkylation response protein AidB-like acyl-CoA dehydrogenase